MGFVIKMNDSGVFMDVRALVLHLKKDKLFLVQHVHYLMILNMTATYKSLMDAEFQDFIIEETGISRAYLFKVLKAMVSSELLERLPKRGWYKLKGIKLHKSKF